MTSQERKIWNGLREGFPDTHFRKQVPIGIYIADFAWHSAKLIIEVDGGQHGSDAGLAHDEKRTAFLEAEGYCVLRFWNSDVDQNLEGVLAIIAEAIRTAEENIGAQTCAAPTLPSPQGGGMNGASKCHC